jgi:hypothetical protein
MGLTRPRFNQLQESDFKSSCRVATTSNVTLSGGTPATVDGVNLQVNDRVLVTGQTDATENGIYFVSTLGSGSNGSWTRALDANENAEVSSGLILTVTEGTLHSSSIWKLTTADPITIGSTELTFVPNLENSNVYVKAVDISDSPATIDSFSASGVTTVRWLISATDNVGGYHKTSTVDAVTNGTTITEIEYGVLLSDSAQDVVTIGTTISGGNIVLQGTGTSANVSVRVNRITLGSDTTTGYIRAQVLASAASAVDLSAVDQDIIPATDVTYDIGSSSYRWRDLYLSGSTIDLGGAQIKTDDTTGSIAFVPPVTESNPNPSALIVNPAGTIAVAATSAGSINAVIIQNANSALPPKISSVEVTDSSGTVLDDTAVDTAGGYIKLNGSGFVSGCQVLIGDTLATSTTFVSGTAVRAQVPATAAGSYMVYLNNPDGGLAMKPNGVTFSSTPTWVTSGTLTSQMVDQAFSIQLSATGATSYALAAGSSLPAGVTLTSAGVLSGTVTGIISETTYSFTVVATDAENQDSPRTFSLTVAAIQLKPYLVKLYGAASGTTFTDSSSYAHGVYTIGADGGNNLSIQGSTNTVYGGTGNSIFFSNPTIGTNYVMVDISPRGMGFKSSTWYVGWWFNSTTTLLNLPVVGFYRNGVTNSNEIMNAYLTFNGSTAYPRFSWDGAGAGDDRTYGTAVPSSNSWNWIEFFHEANTTVIQSRIYNSSRTLTHTLGAAYGGQDWTRWGSGWFYANNNYTVDYITFNTGTASANKLRGYMDSFIFSNTILTAADIPTMEPF